MSKAKMPPVPPAGRAPQGGSGKPRSGEDAARAPATATKHGDTSGQAPQGSVTPSATHPADRPDR